MVSWPRDQGLKEEPRQDDTLLIECVVTASTEAVERVLGVPRDSLYLVHAQALKEWMITRLDQPE